MNINCKHILLEGKKSVNGLEISDNLGYMTWNEAVETCKKLGPGWRLPTKNELNMLYKNRKEIGGFAYNYYWSSTEVDNLDAWFQDFDDGVQYFNYKFTTFYVRAVRAS